MTAAERRPHGGAQLIADVIPAHPAAGSVSQRPGAVGPVGFGADHDHALGGQGAEGRLAARRKVDGVDDHQSGSGPPDGIGQHDARARFPHGPTAMLRGEQLARPATHHRMTDRDQNGGRSITDGAGHLRLAARRWPVDHTSIVAGPAPRAIRPDYGFDAAVSPMIFVFDPGPAARTSLGIRPGCGSTVRELTDPASRPRGAVRARGHSGPARRGP